jgi:hypothetical protein
MPPHAFVFRTRIEFNGQRPTTCSSAPELSSMVRGRCNAPELSSMARGLWSQCDESVHLRLCIRHCLRFLCEGRVGRKAQPRAMPDRLVRTLERRCDLFQRLSVPLCVRRGDRSNCQRTMARTHRPRRTTLRRGLCALPLRKRPPWRNTLRRLRHLLLTRTMLHVVQRKHRSTRP